MSLAHVISSNWKRTAVALLLFGVSFGYVEAAVVTYSGALYEPVRQRFYPKRPPSDVFPLLTEEQLKAAGPEHLRLLKAELAQGLSQHRGWWAATLVHWLLWAKQLVWWLISTSCSAPQTHKLTSHSRNWTRTGLTAP